MSSIFKPKIDMPPAPQIEIPDESKVPDVEDAARLEAEAAELRRRNAKRKGRRSTILTGPQQEDIEADLKKPLLGD